MNLRRSLVIVVLFLIVLLPMLRARSLNDPRLNGYDALHYDLAFSFDFLTRTFEGTAGLDASLLKPSYELALSASNATLTIDSVRVDGHIALFTHTNDLLIISLSRRYATGEHVRSEIFYRGMAQFQGQYDAGGMYITLTNGFGRVSTSSEPNFARTWWPCKDVPNDKATVTVRLTVPTNLIGLSNGTLKSTQRTANATIYEWVESYPVATYLVSVAVGYYRQFSDNYTGIDPKQRMKISYYVYPEDIAKARVDFADTPDILHYFASTFCEYPFIKEKFGYVEVSGNMTMENQTLCSIDDRHVTGDGHYADTYVHEIAHHWWGNLITPVNWLNTWLNEGFATYAEALYAEHLKGIPGYQSHILKLMNVKMGQYAGSVIGQSDTSYWDSFSPRVYDKGALVLHMLRGVMGDDAFFTVMRNYINNPKFRYANASTEDFIGECERVYGKSLKWFFDEWVYAYTEGIDRPEYRSAWTGNPSGDGYSVTLTLEQKTAAKLVYRMPMTVSVVSSAGMKNFAVVDSLALQNFTFRVSDKPTSVEVDRNNWIFKIIDRREGF